MKVNIQEILFDRNDEWAETVISEYYIDDKYIGDSHSHAYYTKLHLAIAREIKEMYANRFEGTIVATPQVYFEPGEKHVDTDNWALNLPILIRY